MIKFTTDDFIQRAINTHGNKYDYSLVKYVGARIKVKIICKLHGEFSQTPSAHINKGNGCTVCARETINKYNTNDLDYFLNKAKIVHGDLYSYDKTDYTSTRNKVIITCKIHGDFSQRANDHLDGAGCKKCAIEDLVKIHKNSPEEWLSKCIEVHGSRYDYSLSKFDGCFSKIKIVCKQHGQFIQTLNNHLRGNGCKSCARTGFDTSKIGVLYILQFQEITKIGITNRSVSKRLQQINSKSGKTFKEIYQISLNGMEASLIEKQLLKELSEEYKRVTEIFDGYTECFYNVDVTKLINRIEELRKTNGKPRFK